MNNTDLLEKFADLFEETNQQLNLCKFEDRDEFMDRHIADAAECEAFLENARNLVDLGTGGGLPGIVISILRPDIKVSMVDSIQKKCDAIDGMIKELKLSNAQVVCGRCEEFGQNPYFREKFDVVTARALAPLPVLLELAAGFVRPSGKFIAFKGSSYLEELFDAENAMKVLGFELDKTHKYKLVDGIDRTLLIFTRKGKLDPKYPRENGTPKKKPL